MDVAGAADIIAQGHGNPIKRRIFAGSGGGHSTHHEAHPVMNDEQEEDKEEWSPVYDDDDVSSESDDDDDVEDDEETPQRRRRCNTCHAQRVPVMCCSPTTATQCLECDDVEACMDCTNTCHVQCMIHCLCNGHVGALQYVCKQCAIACERCRKLHCNHAEASQPCVVCAAPLCLKCLFCSKCSFALKSCTACSKTYMNPPKTACVCSKCTCHIKTLVLQHVQKDAWFVVQTYL